MPRALTQYDRTATWGEMGEIIEWLVFGFLSQIDIDGDPSNTYSIICWGSSSLNPDQQVKFGGYVGTRLYTARPPVRMGAEQMRFYVTNAKREERVYIEAERAARRAFQAAVVQVGVDAANALGDAERLRVYGTAPGVAQPELFRLRPQNAFMYREYPPAQDDDDEDEEMGDAAEDAGRDRMEIDLESDPDEHYTSRQIPRSQGRRKAKRYHECVRRVNAEAHRRGDLRKAIRQEQLNNPDPVPQFELAAPPSMFPRLVWEGLRLFLALCLPLGLVWAFQVDFDQIGGSEVWFIAHVCCFSLPLHTTRWLFPLASRTAVQSGHLFALFLALAVYWGLPAKIPQLSLVDEWSGDALLPGLLVLASWRVWWQLWLLVVDQLGWFAMQLLFSSEILRRLTAWLLGA